MKITRWFAASLVFAGVSIALAQVPGRDHNLAMGNPSGATHDAGNAKNYLVEKPQYSLSFNNALGRANWVSWHLSSAWLGPEHRARAFTPDDTLPAGFYRAQSSSYTQSGFDRGHMCPSGDRTASREDNDATFVLSNVVPQTAPNNRKT